jgi:serine/threonine protein phosphatase PrpC
MTLVIVSGWLVTVANTGDSSACLDTGDAISEITVSHRIQVGHPAFTRRH